LSASVVQYIFIGAVLIWRAPVSPGNLRLRVPEQISSLEKHIRTNVLALGFGRESDLEVLLFILTPLQRRLVWNSSR
jgi:hypothetical protein